MESRTCGGCGNSRFLTLTTTSEDGNEQLHRLAYLHGTRDTPPAPDGSSPGEVTASFWELWNPQEWVDLFGEESTLGQVEEGLRDRKLRLSKLIKAPQGVIQARIYHTDDIELVPDGDERCEGFPTLHKNFVIRYRSTSAI